MLTFNKSHMLGIKDKLSQAANFAAESMKYLVTEEYDTYTDDETYEYTEEDEQQMYVNIPRVLTILLPACINSYLLFKNVLIFPIVVHSNDVNGRYY